MNQSRQPKHRLVVRSSSPALKIVVTVLIVFSMAALTALAWVRGSIRSQVEHLRREAAALEQENRELQEKIDGLGSVQSVQDIAREELGEERAPVPEADFGQEESLLPLQSLRRENMEVAAPLFLIGAKLRAEQSGEAAMRQRLLARLALRILCGSSSDFYSRLYAQGVLNRNFDYDIDFSAGTGTIIIGGESQEPEQVLRDLLLEVEKVRSEGLDETAFQQAKRATLGSTLRALEDFENVCVSLAIGLFDGYCAFDSMPVLQSISRKECQDFITENLAPERLALSIIQAKAV